MKTAASVVRRLENFISFSALAVLLVCVLWGVLSRYVTERPAVWTTELSGILFSWVVFVGASTAYRDGRHIRVTMLLDLLPTSLSRIIQSLGDGLTIVFLGYATWLSLAMMMKGASRMSPVMDIPFSYVYLATCIAFSMMTITAVLRLSGLLSDRLESASPEDAL